MVLIFWILLIARTSTQEDAYCQPTTDEETGLEWSGTTNKTLSKPICLNEKKEFLYRECLNGLWLSEPNCSYTQPETLPQCPDGFIDSEDFCYQLTPKSIFPPKCPFEDAIPFVTYKYILEDTMGAVWVPARRQGLSFMQWTETSWLYQTEVDNYYISQTLKDKNCLIFSENTYIAVSCKESHQGICAYKKLNLLRTSMCGSFPNCVQSDFSPNSKCFCRNSFERILYYPKAEFVQPYQYSLLSKLTNETCSFGLEKSDGKYLWSESRHEIGYTYWSTNVTFSWDNIFGAATPTGWVLTPNLLSCVIFQKDLVLEEPSLYLEYNDTVSRFYLTIFNHQSLKVMDFGSALFCFTNADALSLLYSYPTIKIIRDYGTTVVDAFDSMGSGHYWCEAFKFDSTIIRSEVYFLKPNDNSEFVGYFQVRYSEFNPLSKDIIDFLQTILFVHIRAAEIASSCDLRFMKIVDLDEEKGQVLVNIHFSCRISISEEMYMVMKSSINSNVNTVADQVTMVEFLSVDFCAFESGYLTWATTPLGGKVNPAEFCFKPDGTPVLRSCDGDFINGARWSDIDNCEIFKESELTPKLLDISIDGLMADICNISQYHQDFAPLDLYLIGSLLTEFLIVPVVDDFASTVNNLLKINRSVLMESQLKLGATDKILCLIDRIPSAYEPVFEINLDNFVFMSLETKDLSGLVVTKNSDRFVVTKLVGDHTLDDITKIENLQSAIWLSSDFREGLQTERITFSLFFSDAFFLQAETPHTSLIFGIVRPPSMNFVNGPILILHRVDEPHKQDCAFWRYSLVDQGSWKVSQKPNPSPPFMICQFWHYANFALISSAADDNVTENLKDLLESNDSISETMDILSKISEESYKFESVDVSFVGQILEKVNDNDIIAGVSDQDQIDFKSLTKIISNLHEVRREILSQSQIDGGATDTILAHVDSIITNHISRNSTQVVADNFLILIADLKDFSGLVLVRRGQQFETQILNGNVSIDDIIENQGFDSAVLLSPPLKQQMGTNAKIIITVFSNDALFNEKSPDPKVVSRIFGVILPGVEEFAGPVSVLYKADEITSDEQCVHWYYDHPHSVSGSWKKDTERTNRTKAVQCDFWHTTHFAYLILDKDRFGDQSDRALDLLDVLTYISCIISLVSLGCIILTAIFFKRWRENTGNQILLNFTFAIIIQIVVFQISNTIRQLEEVYSTCIIIGVLLHYSIISQFCWMFVIAVLQFRRFVLVLDPPPKFVLLKACFCGWVLPLFPVMTVFAVDRENYVHSKVWLCYPSGNGLYLGVWLPICIIIFINFVIFAITLYNVIHKKTGYVNSGSTDVLYQWRLAVLLFFTLGFTWSFAFLAEFDFGLVFEYLFCMTATLQGFILFLFFVVLNGNTRRLYMSAVGKCCKTNIK